MLEVTFSTSNSNPSFYFSLFPKNSSFSPFSFSSNRKFLLLPTCPIMGNNYYGLVTLYIIMYIYWINFVHFFLLFTFCHGIIYVNFSFQEGWILNLVPCVYASTRSMDFSMDQVEEENFTGKEESNSKRKRHNHVLFSNVFSSTKLFVLSILILATLFNITSSGKWEQGNYFLSPLITGSHLYSTTLSLSVSHPLPLSPCLSSCCESCIIIH